MANVRALHSVGHSLVAYLRNSYPPVLNGSAMPGCEFALLSSGELAGPEPEGTRITLYVYKLTSNEHQRQQRSPREAGGQPVPLGLDLHFLLTSWASNAQDELITLAWAMRQLYQYPLLDAAALSPEAGWAQDEVIQLIAAELSTEDMMRIWDALLPPYRLSVSYIARLVRLDPDAAPVGLPVVATQLAYGKVAPVGQEPAR
jgi:Pvc16 N-terminal domain